MGRDIAMTKREIPLSTACSTRSWATKAPGCPVIWGCAKLHNHQLQEAWDLIHKAAQAGFEGSMDEYKVF